MLELDPAYGGALHGRATVHSIKGDYEAAIRDFTAHINTGTPAPGSFLLRGIAYYYRERYHEAIADLTVSIDRGQAAISAYARRGMCYHKLGMKKREKMDFDAVKQLASEEAE